MEEWRDIPGFEGRYQASDEGNVRSLERLVRLVTKNGGEMQVRKRGRQHRPGRTKSGHVTVAIGRGNSRMVHQLVLEAFIGFCPEKMEVLHMNHIPSDNRLSNLKYGTRSENLKMDYAAGTRKKHPNFNHRKKLS